MYCHKKYKKLTREHLLLKSVGGKLTRTVYVLTDPSLKGMVKNWLYTAGCCCACQEAFKHNGRKFSCIR